MTTLAAVEYTAPGAVIQAWGQWLSELFQWDWFVTMTFRDPPVDTPWRLWTKPGWAYAKRAWRGFVQAAQPALGQLAWVRCFEIQRDRGVVHIHALVGNVDPSVRRMDMVDWAWERYGISRVLEYDPGQGAGYYLSKYLAKDLADIEISAPPKYLH